VYNKAANFEILKNRQDLSEHSACSVELLNFVPYHRLIGDCNKGAESARFLDLIKIVECSKSFLLPLLLPFFQAHLHGLSSHLFDGLHKRGIVDKTLEKLFHRIVACRQI